MKRKFQVITVLLSIAFFFFSNLGIGMLPAMAITKDGSSMSSPIIPAAWHNFQSNTSNGPSELTQIDQGTEDTYNQIGFEAETSTDLKNLTSARVLKTVFNTYRDDSSKPKVFGYYTDWSQYDGRLDNLTDPSLAGRGYDMDKVNPLAYDQIVIGFLGICGDQGEKASIVQTACNQMGYGLDHATFIDLWGDIAAWRNNKFTQQEWGDGGGYDIGQGGVYEPYMYQSKIEAGRAFGALGGLYRLQNEAKALGHDLELAFSIGGWTMSGPFSGIVASPSRRTTLIESIGEVFERFPMFGRVDVDWEYPGGGGLDPGSPNDGENYVLFMGELRNYLDSHGMSDKKISIAASAVPEKMADSNIPQLFQVGLDGINVMTYDFFGGNWAPALAHQTNLKAYENGEAPENQNSIEESVDYLRGHGVDMRKVYIGYAAYSRNALDAHITDHSPLIGTFRIIPEGQEAIGTFDPLASEYNDVLYNYFDPENQAGKNGYHIYTDAEANADYLHSDTSGVFMSIDTPRSVYVKSKYADEQNLGGIFTWTIDQDAGLLANAAHEGAGYEVIESNIDMEDFYFCGENIDRETCEDITGLIPPDPGDKAPVADAGSNQTITGPATVHLNGTGSYDPNDKPITYSWTQSSGPSVSLMNPTTATPSFDAPLPSSKSDTYQFTLEVSNGDKTDTDSVEVVVNKEEAGECGDYDYVYPDGIGSYVSGETIVQGTDGNLYQCKPHPEGGWCNQSPEAYGPVEGWAWSSAWNLHKTCTD
ncbi:glycosyl hydrolase family 18 protein [Okeania sp. SIO3I5]|uniref:glycosyl hydrolase family 18 protein n=1 Tax=Okeania sp. SIO3I5 TaxID=2607805 RepID=UPI0025E78CA3|nr:glycosyl hydrolase family 18 protein [Okeania sp. SIO3I5]